MLLVTWAFNIDSADDGVELNNPIIPKRERAPNEIIWVTDLLYVVD